MKIYRSFIISLWNRADLFDNTGDRSVATNTGVLIPLRQGGSFRHSLHKTVMVRLSLNPFETGRVFSTLDEVVTEIDNDLS